MLKRGQRPSVVDGGRDIQPEIGRDLIVAERAGVQPARSGP